MGRAALASIVLVGVLSIASASGGGVMEGPGWILLEILIKQPSGMVSGTYTYAGMGALQVHWIRTQGDGSAANFLQHLAVATDAGGAGVAGHEVNANTGRVGGFGSAGFSFSTPGAGYVVLIFGGDIIEARYEVDDDRIHWREIARSSEVFSFEPRDFAPLGADVRASMVQAYAVVDSRKTISVEHELIGMAGRGSTFPPPYHPVDSSPMGVEGMTISGPSGTQECPCVFRPWNSTAAAGPGTYEIAWNGAGVRAIHGPIVLLADVPIPR